MRINGRDYRTIWLDSDGRRVHVIDQTRLPHRFETKAFANCEDAAAAIRDMTVRGAPLIGVTGAYGMALAAARDPSDSAIESAHALLLATRPTAVNLRWALDRLRAALLAAPASARANLAYAEAGKIAEEDVAACQAIGTAGAELIDRARRGDGPINILTHCNAGWLATVDWGTALAPIYTAARQGAPIHVWVDETRPRNQGASLTAFELLGEEIPHTVVADNAGGHLMQHGLVDLVIVGSDRTTRAGDVCNKIGTYLKALAAHDNGVPFWVAAPESSIDWNMASGDDVPIEAREDTEVTHLSGTDDMGELRRVRVTAAGTQVFNPGFDVTPARYVSALITEAGVCPASSEGLATLFPARM
jgi:methylthioribose-1-phosphate isomerase